MCRIASGGPCTASCFPQAKEEGPAPTGDPVDGVRRETGRGDGRPEIRDLFADERCSQAILDLLAATDVGRLVSNPAEEDV